jgi:hypothetical protein
MKDPAHPHVDPHHTDAAHPHVRTAAPDPAMRKTALFVVVGSVVAIGAVVALLSSTVREVSVKNTGNVDVRVEYAWTENGNRVTRDRQVAPGNSISFGFQSNSELVVYHPAPDETATWTVIPVGDNDRKFEIAPKPGGVLTANHDGQPIAASLIPVPSVRR